MSTPCNMCSTTCILSKRRSQEEQRSSSSLSGHQDDVIGQISLLRKEEIMKVRGTSVALNPSGCGPDQFPWPLLLAKTDCICIVTAQMGSATRTRHAFTCIAIVNFTLTPFCEATHIHPDTQSSSTRS